MEAINKKINISKSIYYIVILALLSITIILISSKSETVFNIIGYRAYTILSGSMEPTYYPGDVVLVKHKNKTEIEANDVITFIDDGNVVTHRVVSKDGERYTTKGDNNKVEDAKVLTNQDIIGEVSFSIPKIGYLIQFLSRKSVIAVELVLLGLFILLYNRD